MVHVGNERPTSPYTSLRLTADSSTPIGVYVVSAPDEDSWPVELVSTDDRFVTFVIQVEEVEQAETYFIVKVGLMFVYEIRKLVGKMSLQF